MRVFEVARTTSMAPSSGLVRVRMLVDGKVRPAGYSRVHPAGSAVLLPLSVAADLIKEGLAEMAEGESVTKASPS